VWSKLRRRRTRADALITDASRVGLVTLFPTTTTRPLAMVRETRSRKAKSGTDTPNTPVTEASLLFSAQASIKSATPATSDVMDEDGDDDDELPVLGRAAHSKDKGKATLGKRRRAYVEVPTLKSVAKVRATFSVPVSVWRFDSDIETSSEYYYTRR
jgi:hypothetical protein